MRRTASASKVLAVLLITLTGCTKGVTETGIDVNGPAIAVVTVTPTTATVQSGATQQFTVSFNPVPPDTKVVWTVTDTITASIDQTGRLTAKSPGKTTVRAILQINLNTQGAAPVTVTP
jgi:uncharacterized protein YjdB